MASILILMSLSLSQTLPAIRPGRSNWPSNQHMRSCIITPRPCLHTHPKSAHAPHSRPRTQSARPGSHCPFKKRMAKNISKARQPIARVAAHQQAEQVGANGVSNILVEPMLQMAIAAGPVARPVRKQCHICGVAKVV